MLTLNLSTNHNHTILINRKGPVITGFLLCLGLSLSSCDLYYNRVKTQPAIQVENKTMTVGQFSQSLAARLSVLDPLSAKDPIVVKSFKSKITSDFIVDSLIELWFETNKKSLNSKDLDVEIKKYVDQYPNDKTFREELASQNKSYQDWKKSIELSLKRQMLFQDFRGQIKDPTDDELQAYYQTNKLKYFQNEAVLTESILVADENQADVIKSLYKKNSFDKLFKEYSLDKNRTTVLFGWVERVQGSDLDVLFSNKKNELIGPIKFEEGYRLFKVSQRRPSQQKTFDQVKEQVKSEVISLRETAHFSSWLDEQIKRYKIYKNNQALDSMTIETRQE